jgi:hypothetical protein
MPHKRFNETTTSSPAFRCSETARHSLRFDADDDGGCGIEIEPPRTAAEAATPAEASIGIKSSESAPTLSLSLSLSHTHRENPRFREGPERNPRNGEIYDEGT